jgi:hypothetical protein
MSVIFEHIEYPFVKGYLGGIIDRANLRQKNHGKKITEQNRYRKIATEKSQKHNRDKKSLAKSQQQNKNRGSKTAVAKSRQQNRDNRFGSYRKSWQFGNHIIFAYWNCSNCCMVWYRS